MKTKKSHEILNSTGKSISNWHNLKQTSDSQNSSIDHKISRCKSGESLSQTMSKHGPPSMEFNWKALKSKWRIKSLELGETIKVSARAIGAGRRTSGERKRFGLDMSRSPQPLRKANSPMATKLNTTTKTKFYSPTSKLLGTGLCSPK